MINKQFKIIIASAISIVILASVYFLVVQPLLKDDEKEEIRIVELKEGESLSTEDLELAEEKVSGQPTKLIALLPGESLGTSNRIMMAEKAEKANVAEIEVRNKNETFKFIHNLEHDIYFLEGAELVGLNEEVKSRFFVTAGYLLTMARVAAEGAESSELLNNLSAFGLAAEQEPAWFKVTKGDGTSYRVFIGDKIPTLGGYYCMLEGRNAIYVIDTSVEETILGSKYTLLQPLVAVPLESNDYFMIDNFKLYKKGELFMEVVQTEIPEESNALVLFGMTYPAPYKPSDDNFNAVLYTFTNFSGSAVVETDITEETLRAFGFEEYAYRIMFTYKKKDYDIIVSEKTENGTYYVLSRDFYCIIEVPEETLAFLEWEMLRFVEKPVFDQMIDNVYSISVEADGKTDTFIQSGSGKELLVTGNGSTLDTDKYRQFYKSILYIEIADYLETETETNPAESSPICTLNVVLRNGKEYKYEFFFVSTRRCFFTVNGEGEFYVNRERILKLIRDTETILSGGNVIADAPE